jgi:tetratricopeptide (TPR) repeat protein
MYTENEKTAIAAAKSAQNQPRTQLGELRDLLTIIERRIAKLKEIDPNDALEILPLLDKAKARLDTLEVAERSASSEGSQFESLLLQFDKKGGTFLNRVGGPAVLRQARQENRPAKEHWWWWIDEALAQKRQLKIKRWAIGVGIASAILIVLAVVYNRFLAPDPVFQAGIGFQQNAENMLLQGRYEEALAFVDQAIEHLPDYPELYVMRGVIYEMLDEFELAEESYQLAQDAIGKEETFYNHRAKYYLLVNLAEQSIADAKMALSLNPDSAVSLLYLGQAHEVIGDITSAIEYYEAASAAAERAENIQVQVIARMNLAQALQSIGPLTTPTPME